MAATFTITANSNMVALDSARQGKASFVATVTSAQGTRVRSWVTPEGTTSADWFTIEGLPVRDLIVGSPETYSVLISVPAEAPPGNYSFTLNVVGVNIPDEEFAASPSTAFTVTGAKVMPPVKKGYIEALGGGLVGAFAGGAIGAIPALLFFLTTGQPADLSSALGAVICFVFLAVIGAPLGLWIGTAVGVWAGLKWRGCQYPRRSGLVAAVLLPVLLFALLFALGAIHIQNDTISQILTVLVAAISAAGAAAGARALILLMTTRQV